MANVVAPTSTTAPGVVSPSRRSRCARWSGPWRTTGRPASRRESTTRIASAVTTAVSGKSTAPVEPRPYPVRTSTAEAASTKPVNRDPQAPKAIRAGCQLCMRKPVSAAASTLSSTARSSIISAAAHAPAPNAVSTPTVPASPSAWSRPRKAAATQAIQSTAAIPAGTPVSS